MKRVSTATRLSISLVALTLSVLLAAQTLGLVPDPAEAARKGRRDLSESLAIGCSLAAQQGDPAHNAVTGEYFGLETTNSLVYGSVPGKLIATIGLDNLIIVDTPDVLLVCARSKNQDVKKVVEALKDQGKLHYL